MRNSSHKPPSLVLTSGEELTIRKTRQRGKIGKCWLAVNGGSVVAYAIGFQQLHFSPGNRVNVAIIGAGISGLTSAYILSKRHEVDLIEAQDYLGGHTNTLDVTSGGSSYAVDTGFIVFNDRTYPNFCRLLDELEIASQPTNMSFSVRCDRSGFEFRGGDLDGLFAQRRNLASIEFYRFVLDILRFNRQADADGLADTLTVEEYFREARFGEHFVQRYFYPMAAAIWSCPAGKIGQFPMKFIIEFYRNHGLLSLRDRPQWRVICGGSRNYIRAMLAKSAMRTHVCCPVIGVSRHVDRVTVHTSHWTREFDHVVFACHSDQALKILGKEATDLEKRVLGAFPYEKNEAILHTDWSLLPHRQRAWASWNYRIPACPSEKVLVTYAMNILQGITAEDVFCVTLNGESMINPKRILRKIAYAHPIFSTGRAAAQRQHSLLIGPNRTSFCGAYWGNGFHEDGVKSALAVCDQLSSEFQVTLPHCPERSRS